MDQPNGRPIQVVRAAVVSLLATVAKAVRNLFSFRKRLFCEHEWSFRRNYYGDEILERNFNRSAWQCNRCGAWRDRPDLVSPSEE